VVFLQKDKVQVQQTKIKGAEEEAARLQREKDAAEDKLSKLAKELEGSPPPPPPPPHPKGRFFGF